MQILNYDAAVSAVPERRRTRGHVGLPHCTNDRRCALGFERQAFRDSREACYFFPRAGGQAESCPRG